MDFREDNSSKEIRKADDASIIFENTGDLLKSMKNFAGSVGEQEKKHPYGKGSSAARTYGGGMKNSASAFTRSGDQFDKLFAACSAFKDHINSAILAKLISFKDIEWLLVFLYACLVVAFATTSFGL
ncbi:Protein CBG03837 [Caenorhabditis briggsae]|uniref:Protein CBG03837 n=1 Tax=Caenorhabditis briggsae TaxID=6238 RepID=A8WWV8_CAEBR|nr:Protein CBG03837 [Caenorhabditis briggsae]CAP24662.2 Protein CBG03837 [Caenorhabditis briggsae]